MKSPWQYLYPYTNTNISIFNLTSMKGFLNICVTELNEHNLLCVHGWQRYSFFSIHLFHIIFYDLKNNFIHRGDGESSEHFVSLVSMVKVS